MTLSFKFPFFWGFYSHVWVGGSIHFSATEAERMLREAEERARDADRWSGARVIGGGI